jgi:hypothetical protein
MCVIGIHSQTSDTTLDSWNFPIHPFHSITV